MDCKTSFDGASYDLNELATQLPAQTVHDVQQSAEKDYLYTFGICKTVAPPTNCLNADGSSRVRWDWSPGWQTKSTESPTTTADRSALTCHYLGSPMADAHEWKQLDDPSKGVTLTYTDGQTCHSQGGGRRKLHLMFQCAPTTVKKIEQLVIDEANHCEYEIKIDTEYACPLECGLQATGSVCGGHGICGFDRDTNKAKCYCNSGRSGQYCTAVAEAASDDSDYGPVLGLLIFVTIVVVVVLGMLVALWRFMQTRKVEVMGDVYTSLHNSAESFEIERVDMSEPDRRDSFEMPNTQRPVFSAERQDTKLETIATQL